MQAGEKNTKKRSKKEIIDFIEIKKPFLPDIRIIHKIIKDRIDHYKKRPILEEDLENDITLSRIKKEISCPEIDERTNQILERFTSLTETEEKRTKSLMEITQKKNITRRDIEVCIDEYLNIASEYIRISVYPENNKKKSKCPHCENYFEKNESDPNTGILECSRCGYEIQNSLFVPSLRDGNNNTSFGNGYEDRDNFIKKMQRKQGKLHSSFSETLFDDLDEVMRKRGYPKGADVRKMPLNNLGEKDGTSLEMLVTALADIKCPKYYNDVDYIAHVYWGWTLLDFSPWESDLLQMYDVTQRIYNEIENKERVAALNTEVRLYLQLRSLGQKVSRTRFRFQDSQESLEFHQSMWRIMCEKAKYTYHSI